MACGYCMTERGGQWQGAPPAFAGQAASPCGRGARAATWAARWVAINASPMPSPHPHAVEAQDIAPLLPLRPDDRALTTAPRPRRAAGGVIEPNPQSQIRNPKWFPHFPRT